MEARTHAWELNGLRQNVLEWSATDDASTATVAIAHGFQDAAATFDDVAEHLVQSGGLRAIAPDMRSFGDGPHVAPGAYYYFPDYIADLVALLDRLGPAPIFLVGHSMGASVVTQLAGAFPERIAKLALIDGVGPPDNPFEVAPMRMRRWIEDVNKVRRVGEAAQKIASIDEGVSRLQTNHREIDPAILRRRAMQLARVGAEGESLRWAFDPLHRTMSPVPFYAEAMKAFMRAVTCPVLHVSGGPKGHHVPDEDERLKCFAQIERAEIDGGHMLHWTRPRELAETLARFWSAAG